MNPGVQVVPFSGCRRYDHVALRPRRSVRRQRHLKPGELVPVRRDHGGPFGAQFPEDVVRIGRLSSVDAANATVFSSSWMTRASSGEKQHCPAGHFGARWAVARRNEAT